jgi:hypothetical protein
MNNRKYKTKKHKYKKNKSKKNKSKRNKTRKRKYQKLRINKKGGQDDDEYEITYYVLKQNDKLDDVFNFLINFLLKNNIIKKKIALDDQGEDGENNLIRAIELLINYLFENVINKKTLLTRLWSNDNRDEIINFLRQAQIQDIPIAREYETGNLKLAQGYETENLKFAQGYETENLKFNVSKTQGQKLLEFLINYLFETKVINKNQFIEEAYNQGIEFIILRTLMILQDQERRRHDLWTPELPPQASEEERQERTSAWVDNVKKKGLMQDVFKESLRAPPKPGEIDFSQLRF